MIDLSEDFRAYCGVCAFKRHGSRDHVWKWAVHHYKENESHRESIYFGHGYVAGRLNDENVNRSDEKLRKMLGEQSQGELFK